jgi:hypothetical protein
VIDVERLLSRTRRTRRGCRVWIGAHDQKGYGQVRIDKKCYRVHRLIWQAKHGPIPRGVLICHECDNPPCAEELHLFAGTPKDNTADMTRKGRHRGRFAKGVRPKCTRFTPTQVRRIRREYAIGVASQVTLAARYRTSQGHISNIVHFRAWSTVQ